MSFFKFVNLFLKRGIAYTISVLISIPFFLLVGTVLDFTNSLEKLQVAAIWFSVQIWEMYRPIGSGELHSAALKRCWQIYKILVLTG